ncbi:replication protein A 70 kDa DNA-binding subunit B [Tanacetum coccineum]
MNVSLEAHISSLPLFHHLMHRSSEAPDSSDGTTIADPYVHLVSHWRSRSMVTIAEFFHGAVKKMKSHCIVYARIHRIHKENKWAYTAYKECNKKVNVVESKAMSSSGKSKVTFYYEDHGVVQVASRYKVIMWIIDQSGYAPIVFFNTMINKLSGYTAWELMEKHGMDVDKY